MVTVAKSLDVPIKLVFPRPPADATSTAPSYAMLGLGDVVLPGIMIGLALRFDLWLFYLRRQKRVPASDGEGEKVIKPEYFSLSGRWSDHFWSHSFTGRPLFHTSSEGPSEQPFTFPKTYFKASLIGYVIGMLTTLGVMHIWGHAQPALLYLVPGVLGSLWLTALVRGEIGLMWNFTEEAEDDSPTDTKNEENFKSKERSSFFSLSDKKAEEREARAKRALRRHISSDDQSEADVKGGDGQKNRVKAVADHKSDREVFSFSIEAPWKLKHPRSIQTASKDDQEQESGEQTMEDKPNRAPHAVAARESEPPGKRVRLS